jgi:ATP-binding cassette subfamily B multidrug efflux pump
VKEISPSQTWRPLWPYLRPDLGWYLLALVAAPAATALTVLQPQLLQRTIDGHIAQGDVPGAQRLALAYLATVLGAFALDAIYNLALTWGATATITRLRGAVYGHALRLGMSYFDRVPSGRLLTRVTSDVEALGETLTAGALTIGLDVLTVSGLLVGMFFLEPRLALVLLLVAPPLAWAIDAIRRQLRRLFDETRTALSELTAYTAERLTGVQVLQLHRDEARALAAFDARLAPYRRAAVTSNLWDALLFALVDGVSALCMALMLWYGTSEALAGVATPGLLAAFIDAIGRLFTPIREFSGKIAVIQRAGISLRQIFGLLMHDERVPSGDRALPSPVGDLCFDHVTFAYAGGPPVLTDLSLRVAPGEVVALVGRTGSGKSTIGRLALRLYGDWQGTIHWGGVPLEDIAEEGLRAQIAPVSQDVQLFPGTVRDNLCLGRPLPDAVLQRAIQLAHADGCVARLGGLDAPLAAGGRELSGGEAQLLAFARVLAHDPPMVLLDEATAAVDTLTERAIEAATAEILRRKTVLVVAHRLSTIARADRILLLDGGRVLEQGTHAELMAQEGRYAALVRQSNLDDPADGLASGGGGATL